MDFDFTSDQVMLRSTARDYLGEKCTTQFVRKMYDDQTGFGKEMWKEMADMGALITEMMQKGVLITTDGLQHSRKGARVSVKNGTFTVTDGPFTETKELVAGFAIIEVPSKTEAIEWTKRFLSVVGHGESELRLMQDAPGASRQV